MPASFENISLPDQYKNIPKIIHPFFINDLKKKEESGLIPLSNEIQYFRDECLQKCTDPSLDKNIRHEYLASLVYITIGIEHGNYYPPQDMAKFRKQVASQDILIPDCGAIASEVSREFERSGFKSLVSTYRCMHNNKNDETQQVFCAEIKKDELYYAVDCARFYYGLPSEQWYHIEESHTLEGVLRNMVINFREHTKHANTYDRKNWKCLHLDDNDKLPEWYSL